MITTTLPSWKMEIPAGYGVVLRRQHVQQEQHVSCGGSCFHPQSQKESTQKKQGSLSKRVSIHWNRYPNTPHRSEKNGIVRRMKSRNSNKHGFQVPFPKNVEIVQ